MLTQFRAAPGVIDLAWGHPQPELLATDLVAEAARRAVEQYGADALGYGAQAGPQPLVEWLTEHLGAIDDRQPAPGELLITAGASQGLDLACTLLARPGDVCLVPVPTYHLAVRVLRDHPLEIEPVASDDHGVRPDAVGEAIDRVKRSGRRPRLLYLVPTSGNPTGITLGLERRTALASIVAGTDLVILEDDVYRA
jgi:DNA-binding transcriptional MocR family regulator